VIRAAVLLILLSGGAAFAAAPEAPPTDGTDAAEEDAARGLPASMRKHGVIGHIPSEGDYNILDPGILTDMRSALILLGEGAAE